MLNDLLHQRTLQPAELSELPELIHLASAEARLQPGEKASSRNRCENIVEQQRTGSNNHRAWLRIDIQKLLSLLLWGRTKKQKKNTKCPG